MPKDVAFTCGLLILARSALSHIRTHFGRVYFSVEATHALMSAIKSTFKLSLQDLKSPFCSLPSPDPSGFRSPTRVRALYFVRMPYGFVLDAVVMHDLPFHPSRENKWGDDCLASPFVPCMFLFLQHS